MSLNDGKLEKLIMNLDPDQIESSLSEHLPLPTISWTFIHNFLSDPI